MDDQTKKRLDEIFAKDAERKHGQAQDTAAERARSDAFNTELRGFLDGVAIPVLNEFAAALSARSRFSEVVSDRTPYLPPSAGLLVQRAGIPFDRGCADHFTIGRKGAESRVYISEQILHTKRRGLHAGLGDFTIGELTPQKLNEILLGFVERIMSP